MTAEPCSLWPLDDSCNIQFDYAQLQLINNSINSAKSHLRITRNNCPRDINNAQSTKNNHTHTQKTFCNSIRMDYFEACLSGQKVSQANWEQLWENTPRKFQLNLQRAEQSEIADYKCCWRRTKTPG